MTFKNEDLTTKEGLENAIENTRKIGLVKVLKDSFSHLASLSDRYELNATIANKHELLVTPHEHEWYVRVARDNLVPMIQILDGFLFLLFDLGHNANELLIRNTNLSAIREILIENASQRKIKEGQNRVFPALYSWEVITPDSVLQASYKRILAFLQFPERYDLHALMEDEFELLVTPTDHDEPVRVIKTNIKSMTSFLDGLLFLLIDISQDEHRLESITSSELNPLFNKKFTILHCPFCSHSFIPRFKNYQEASMYGNDEEKEQWLTHVCTTECITAGLGSPDGEEE